MGLNCVLHLAADEQRYSSSPCFQRLNTLEITRGLELLVDDQVVRRSTSITVNLPDGSKTATMLGSMTETRAVTGSSV